MPPDPDFRAIFEAASGVTVVVLANEPEFTIIAASDAYVRVSGISREHLVGGGIFDIFPDNPNDPSASGVANLRNSFRQTIAARLPDQLPIQRYGVEKPAAGHFEERYWTAVNTPILAGGGEVRYILHSVEEVTDKVRAEQRALVVRDLEISSRRIRLAQRAGRTGSFEWFIPEGQLLWTPELEALFGLREGTFEGTLEDWIRRVVPEDAERVMAGVHGCFARQQTEYTFEFRALLPGPSRRWLRGQSQIFYDGAGAPLRMIGVNIDIDGQKRAEETLRKSEERQALMLGLSRASAKLPTPKS